MATHGAIVNYGSTRSNGDGKEGKKNTKEATKAEKILCSIIKPKMCTA